MSAAAQLGREHHPVSPKKGTPTQKFLEALQYKPLVCHLDLPGPPSPPTPPHPHHCKARHLCGARHESSGPLSPADLLCLLSWAPRGQRGLVGGTFQKAGSIVAQHKPLKARPWPRPSGGRQDVTPAPSTAPRQGREGEW